MIFFTYFTLYRSLAARSTTAQTQSSVSAIAIKPSPLPIRDRQPLHPLKFMSVIWNQN
jgi:hypothetical protein